MKTDPIHFEDIKWGTFKRQFTAYRASHPKSLITTLEDFAKDILEHPTHYQEHTVKRARFYTRVLARKSGENAASLAEPNQVRIKNGAAQPNIQVVVEEIRQPEAPLARRRRRRRADVPCGGSNAAQHPKEGEEEVGGRLAVQEIKDLIDSSYDPKRTDLTDFDYDPELSSDRAKVYKRKNSNQAVVVHRGTQGLSDVALDLRYSLGQDITNSDRFRHAKNIQERAEKKYGAENVSTVGHSLGSLAASTVGKNSHEIINVNKAVAPQDFFKPISNKETNIRTKYDPVSALLAFKGNKNTFTIPSTSMNPLTEHSTDALLRLGMDQQFGEE
jgi:hypothetical protein